MPKFGMEVTGMSLPDLSGASHISSGVENRSKGLGIASTAGLIEGVGKAGIAAYQGYQLAQEHNEMVDLVQSQIDARDPNTIFEEPGKDTPTVRSFSEQLKRLNNAKAQGVLSEPEFESKVTTILRSAINKNPSLSKELTSQTEEIYRLSGLKSTFKAEEQAIKSASEQIKQQQDFILSVAKEAKTPLMLNQDGSTDFYGMYKANTKWQEEQQVLAQADNQTKFTTDQFRQFGTTYATGLINRATDLSINIFKDPTGNYATKMTQVNMLLDSVERDFTADSRVGSIIDQAPVKATHDYIKTQINAIKTNLKEFESGELAAKYLENSVKMLRDQQYQDVSKVANPVAIDMLSKLTANAGVADFITKHPELKVQLYTAISRLTDGLSLKGTGVLSSVKPGEKPIGAVLLEEVATSANRPDSNPEHFSNTIDSIEGGLETLPLPEKFNFYRDYVKVFGEEKNKEGINKLDGIRKEKAISHVSDYAAITFYDLTKKIQQFVSNGDKIVMDVLPNGKLSITSDNPKTNQELQKRYVFRINDSLNAFANLKGYASSKEAAKDFYNQYREWFVPVERTPSGGTVRKVNPQTTEGTIKQ